MRIGVRQVVAVLVLLIASACAEPPTKEMDQAQGALDAARAAGAVDYAAEALAAADAALARSRQAVTDRDYRQALNFALDARDRAQTAARQAADEKARVRTETDRALRAADASLVRARTRVDAAVAARVSAPATTGARKTLASAEQALASAQTAFDAGEFRRARALVESLPGQIDGVSSEMDAAIGSRPARRPTRRNRPQNR